jgi:hypothetical protein
MIQRRASLGIAAVTVAALLAVGSAPAGGQSILLQPKFEKGQKNYVERITSATQKRGRDSVQINGIFGVIEEVESAANDQTRFTLIIDRCGMSVGGAAPVSFDTDLPDAGQTKELAAIFRPRVGMKMTMVVDKNLKVKSFKGVKAIVKKLDKSAAGNLLWAKLRESVTAAEYKVMWGNSRLVLFPNKEVKVGDTWSGSFTQSDTRLGELKNEYSCKLDGVTEKDGAKEATVSYKVVVTKVGEPKKEGGHKFAFQSSESEGTAVFDSVRGCFVKINEKNSTTLDTEMRGRQVPLTITGEEKLSVLSVKTRSEQREKRQQSEGEEAEKKTEKKPPRS